MSGWTPKAIGSVTGRNSFTATPLRRMISAGTERSFPVCDSVSTRFSAQLRMTAESPEESGCCQRREPIEDSQIALDAAEAHTIGGVAVASRRLLMIGVIQS